MVELPVNVFVSVTLEKQVEERLDAFEAAIRQRPEVLECYLMTGKPTICCAWSFPTLPPTSNS